MDNPQALSRQIGLTRGKAAMIAVLAVVLVAVLYVQFGPSGDDDHHSLAADQTAAATSSKAAAVPPTAVTTANGARATGAKAAVAFNQARWKSPDLSSVIAFDPFAVPDAFPKSAQITAGVGNGTEAGPGDPAAAAQLTDAVEQFRLELEALQQRGVHVILKQRDQYVAMIGDRTVHVGDEIGGFTVTAIEPDHVRVEKKVQ